MFRKSLISKTCFVLLIFSLVSIFIGLKNINNRKTTEIKDNQQQRLAEKKSLQPLFLSEKLPLKLQSKTDITITSVIVSTWRSGSTFLGDILNAVPGNFYHYEPLSHFGVRQIRDSSEAASAVETIRKLLNCDYENMDKYLELANTELFWYNTMLWKYCKENMKQNCSFNPPFLRSMCLKYPVHSMKVVRLRLKAAGELLNDEK